MSTRQKQCIICDSDSWYDVDYLRSKSQNMIVCKECGFITFDRFKSIEEYELFYQYDYRQMPVTVDNLITTNRKLGYHEFFISDYLKKNKDLCIYDIGAGIGYFLRWARDKYGHKRVSGCEFVEAFRNYAYNAFDITLTARFDDSLKSIQQKYDLIVMYHSLEHIPDPVVFVSKVKQYLAEGGKLYIATPTWMGEMTNFGGMPFKSFDDYFHENHLNAWSKKQFRYFLKKMGLRIIKDESKIYGYTVLCEASNESVQESSLDKQDYKDVVYQLETMQKASRQYQKGDYREAIRLYPKFCDAYMAEVGQNQGKFDMQMKIIEAYEKICSDTVLSHVQRAILFFQYNMLDQAEEQFRIALNYRRCDENILQYLAIIAMKKADALMKTDIEEAKKLYKRACEIFDVVIGINPLLYAECYNFIARCLSIIPCDRNEKPQEFKQPQVDGAPTVAFDSSEKSV